MCSVAEVECIAPDIGDKPYHRRNCDSRPTKLIGPRKCALGGFNARPLEELSNWANRVRPAETMSGSFHGHKSRIHHGFLERNTALMPLDLGGANGGRGSLLRKNVLQFQSGRG